MESSLGCTLSYSDRFNLLILRPIIAISFVLSFLVLGWFLAWKLLLVHVPLVQEIFGLKKKPSLPKPTTRHRFSRFYNTLTLNHNDKSNVSAHSLRWRSTKEPMLYTRLLPLAYVPLKSSPITLFRPNGRSRTRVAELLPDVSLHRAILNGFRTFCSSKDLSLQKCVPCNKKDLSPMTEESASVLKPKVPEWEMVNDGGVMKLCRKWKAKNFLQGLELFKVVGDLAETEGHHPDLHLMGWNNVRIEIWTHACGKTVQEAAYSCRQENSRRKT